MARSTGLHVEGIAIEEYDMEASNVTGIPKAYRVPDACKALGIGKSTLYRLAQAQKVRIVKIGGRSVVPAGELERLATQGTA